MLLMQDPKLLLLDEPVAGMTDEETERTAELFLTLKGKHSADGGGARHELHQDHQRDRHRAVRRLACWRKARWTRCRPTSA
jgi:ABC-type Mn2+/Zn2+ transport system ATPase subunit